jgi:gamma-glutamyltranspeptidase
MSKLFFHLIRHESESLLQTSILIFVLGVSAEQKIKAMKDAANRWTDNIFIMKKMFQSRNSSISDKQFFAHLELPEEFDYVE